MKAFLAAVGLSAAALAAAPASALTFYDANGELFVIVEGGSDIFARVEFTVSDGSDEVTTGNATAFASSGEMLSDVGVFASIDGGTDAPGGTSENDLFLDVTFIIENTSTSAPGAGGPDQEYFAGFVGVLSSETTANLPGETVDALAAITGVSGFGGPVGAFVDTIENEPIAEFDDILASVQGSLAPGQSDSYGFLFDLSALAFTPALPGGGGAEVPLPGAGAMMVLGLGALVAKRRRRKA